MKTIIPLLLLTLAAVSAQAATPNAAGHWQGAITLPGTKLEVAVELKAPAQAGQPWSGTIDIPAQMLRGFALTEVTVEGSRVAFKMPNIPGEPAFDGKMTDDGNRVVGDFRQNGQAFPFALNRGEATRRSGETPSHGVPGKGLAGHWQGSLRPGAAPVELRLVLHVTAGKGGALSATVDSIDQGADGIPVSSIALKDDAVTMELAAIKASYEGKLSAEGSEIEGTWKQGEIATPLLFRRLAAAPKLARPQEPKPPFPYQERKVKFSGGASGVTLAGTLTVPPGQGPFPGVILLSGSGAQDRDETLMGHRPFLVLADYLSRHGIAVLRYDDRGYAASTGDYATATHEDFAADAGAAFKFLIAQEGIDPSRVGLCGHSEGAPHAAIAAAGNPKVAFVVMLAGIGVPVDQLLTRQRQDIMRVAGVAQLTTPEETALRDKLFAFLRTEKATDKKEVRALLEQMAARYTPEQREAVGFTESAIDQQVAMLTSPWFLKLLAFDPVPILAKVKCPVLALNGEKDLQVSFRENLDGIRKGLEAGGNREVTVRALPELNHLFQHSSTGAISEYGQIEETMSPEVLQIVGDWIERQTRKEKIG
ncbi:MAG: alpha/beta hydrolase [Chthoniobacterales bacterium]